MRSRAKRDGDMATRTQVIVIVIVIMVILVITGIALYFAARNRTTTALTTTAVTCDVLIPPKNITATSTAPSNNVSTITVSWSPVSGASRYKVYLSDTSGFTAASAQRTKITDTTQATMTNLTAGVTYYVFVTTIGSCGSEGVKSEEASASVGFPDQFKISSRSHPFYVYSTITDPTLAVTLQNDCQGINNFCYWNYNSTNQWITSAANPAYCLISFPNPPNADKLQLLLCSSLTTNPELGRWVYNKDLGKLCHTGVLGAECSKLIGPFSPGSIFQVNNYDSTPSMIFDISV